MTQIKIRGSNSTDDISTGDLHDQYPSNTGFYIESLGGDDDIILSFIGRAGVDFVDAGKGDDKMTLYPAYYQGPVHSYATFSGGYGTDDIYIPGGRLGASGFTLDDTLIKFGIYSDESNELVEVSASSTVEIINIAGTIYLTEDISNGRIRSVDTSEMISRTYDENADWYLYGLDTYTEYHSPTPTSSTTSKTTNSSNSTSSTNIKSKRLKKVEKQAKKMVRNGSLYGFEFDDLEITGTSIKSVGDFNGLGEMDLVINFNNRTKVKSIVASLEYDDIDGRLIQSYTFTNYNKWAKATKSRRWEATYSDGINEINIGTVDSIQTGVDLIERLPGIADLQIQSLMFDGSPSNLWT